MKTIATIAPPINPRPSVAKASPRVTPELERLAKLWSNQHPDDAPQIAKAIPLATHEAIASLDGGDFLVLGDRGISYRVSRSGRCSCPDFTYRGVARRCKHLWAAALFVAANTRKPANDVDPSSPVVRELASVSIDGPSFVVEREGVRAVFERRADAALFADAIARRTVGGAR